MFETDFFPLAQDAKHSNLLPDSLDHLQENAEPPSLQDWGQEPGSKKLPEFRPDESRLKVFSALALGDDADDESKRLVKAEGYQAPATPDEEACLGLDVCVSLFGLDQAADPYLYWARQGKEAPRFKDMGDAHCSVWQDFSEGTKKRYADYQQKKAEFQRGLEEFGNELGTALPEAVLTGKPLTPDMMEKATRYGQAERITASLQRARAAVDLLRGVNRGGASYGAHEGTIHAEAERMLRKENKDGTTYRFLGMEFGKPKTEEEAEQQARANLGHSYEVTREFISHLVNVLSDEDGQLDEGALGAMMLALDADAQGQQTIDSKFVRNMGEALKRWWTESDDFLKRYTRKDPFNEFLDTRNALMSGKPLTLEDSLANKQQEEETHRRLYEDPRVEKLKSALSRLEDTRLSAADKAGFLSGSLTELGTITGDSAPAVLSGFISGGLSVAAFAPPAMNQSISNNYAEGRKNAELEGLITGGFEALAEGSFGVAVRRVPFVGKLMDKAAMGLIGKPVVGKVAAAVQSNWFLRYLGDRVVGESFGELVGEEVISQTGSYLTIQGLRGLGVNMDAPEWKPFSTAWENIQDERQSAATVAYCAALGLMGLSADTRAAREFSRSRENLMTVGLTPETATRLAAMTEDAMNQAALLQAGGDLNASKLRELDDKLQTEYRDAYQKEVVNEDPVKLRDRLKKNHDLFMNDIDAQVALKEGVLKAALREQGVLDVEESLTGKNVVTVEDTEQAEKDRASWQDVQMPEGYETPVKKVEWTDEQLAAYSQYAIGNEGLKRMKAIRSAALNLDMAAKVDGKDYAKTLPLTESAVPVAAELARSKGAITIDALRAISEAAAKEGEAGRNVLPGVSNAVVGAMEESFVKRLQWEARSGNTASASRLLAGEGGAAAIRLTAGEGPASRILYNPGHTLSTNLTEDVVESMLVDKMRKEGGMDNQGAMTDAGKEWLAAMHRDMQMVRRQVLAATGKDIMPGLEKAEPSLMNVAEYFSHLSQSTFYQQAGQYGLNDAAMRHVQFMDAALVQAKYLNDMGAGFAKWADTEAGRAWRKDGGTLAGLLRETGHELADLYTSSRITAENVAAVEEARMYRRANGARTVEDIREELEAAEQEETPVTPESELEARRPQEIPAEESITGEAIPAEANEEVPDADPEGGEFVPPPGSVIETDPEGKGLGLEGGRYAEDGVEGSVIGMVPFSSLVFSELPYAGYLAADGMAEVLRHADGKMEVIMGGALLRQEQRSMKVRVWDADATRNEAWARGRALEQMVLAALAPKVFSVWDYLEYYRHLYPAGLPDRGALGKLGKKAQQAVTIQEKAAPELVQDVLSGAVSAADAYAAVETAATQDGQRFFLTQKTTDKKANLEYLTALTRAYEAAPRTEVGTLQHQARYTVTARKEIRKTISRLRDVRGEKPRAVAQRELGIDLPTAEAVADAITRLDLLDASFDAFESDLDIPGRAAEWDGKSPVHVVGDFMEAREEVKQMATTRKVAEALADEQQREASRPKAEGAEEKTAPDKLEDAGRKILAHKDNYTQGYTSPLKTGLPEDAAAVTVSKYFPLPNYEKLINEGMSQDAVVALCLVRDSIPDKPRGWRARSGYMTQWMQAFQLARQLSADLLEGRTNAQEVISRLKENDVSHRVAIYTGVGYPLCLKARGFTINESVFWSRETDTREKGWGLSHESDKRGFVSSGKRHVPDSLRFKKYDTVEEAISDLRLLLTLQSKRAEESQNNGKKGKKPVKLEVGRYSRGARAGEVVIYKRLTGGVHVVLKGGFKDFQEAREYREAHLDELAAKLKRISSEPDIFPVVSAERVGEDYRGGKDVDNAMFMETFGINGITYGNWVAGPERQAKLNATYDAFMDLANLLGIPPRVISLSGELGIQFGASGRGSAMAHYRLEDVSINLTRKLGSGSLAHEWFHALDNYFQRRAGRALEMSSDHIRSGTDAMGMNDQAAEAFVDLVRAIRNSDYKTRSGRMPGKPGYWDSTTELMARAFQVYVVKKMEAEGLVNEYLSNYSTEEAYDAKDEEYKEAISESRYPYPTSKEMEKFGPKFDAFIQALTHTKQENGNYVTFSVTAPNEIMLAPNGRPSNLTPKQYGQVRTPEFKRWFGDWEHDPENASKVVDENGEPLVVYHGTPNEFTVFRNTQQNDAGWLGKGYYFYGVEEESHGYMGKKGGHLMPLFLNIRDPYYLSETEHDELVERDDVDFSAEFTEQICEDGYDGVYYNGDLRREWMALYPTQIKSATDNRGTFDAGNTDITFSVTALDESGAVLKPEAFITRPDGNPDWFTIPKRKGQPAMPVRLLVGEDTAYHKGYGLTHIAASRDSDGLWAKTTPERFLSGILANVSELWEISPGRELLVKGKKPSAWMVLQLVRQDGYYSIVTAHPVAGSKKPNGKKLPLAERIAGKNQTRVDRSQRPANPDAIPGAFPGGQENETATLASTAGGGDVFSLPPGARVVNINDVRLRFDDGRQMQAGSPVSTMSLALMDDGLDSAPHLKERVVQQLIGDVRTAVRRFNRVFAGSTSTESAARELGQAQALLGMINKYANRGYRPRLAAQMRYVEVYARMLESGKLLSYGKLSAQELESLKEDLEADLADALEVSARGTAWEEADAIQHAVRSRVLEDTVRSYAKRQLAEQEKMKEIYYQATKGDTIPAVVRSAIAHDLEVSLKGMRYEANGKLQKNAKEELRDTLARTYATEQLQEIERRAAAYTRMIETGELDDYGKLTKEELSDIEKTVFEKVDEKMPLALEKALTGRHEELAGELALSLTRDYAGRKLDEVVRDMLNQGAAQLEKQLKDEEIARIGNLLDFLRPRKDAKTGKLKKGLMNADAYRRVARITRMMEAPVEKKAEEMERLNHQLAADELAEADHDRISLDLLDWSAYGALESMSLDAVRAAGESLRELVLAERNVWESRLEDEKNRLKKVAMDAAAVLGRADATKILRMKEKEEKAFRKFGIIGRHLMSFSQAMYAMSGMPSVMKELARETLDAVADGHVILTAREKAVMDQLEGFMKDELGLKKKRQRADFIQGLKKTIKTGIVREKVKIHSLDLTVEEAQRWLSMSKDERQAERDRLREEAESKGWTAGNVVEEDDLLPLKDALNTALNPPPRIDGKKGRKRERVQVRREWMEKQEPLEASADQLLNVILTYEQPFYAENARINGYTPEVLDALRRKVGADALAYGYKMRDLLSESGVAEEFERREGVPFPAQTNYWMSRFHDSSRINQDRDALDMERGTGTRYGMLIQRVDHRHEVDLSLGASNVFLAACAQQNNYLVMGRMTAKWRRLLANKEFAGALNQRLGDGLFASLKQMLDLLDGAGVMEAVTQRAIGSLLGMFQSAHAVSVLSAALTTIAKQPSALMHAAAFKSPIRVIKQLLLDRAGAGRISFGEMLRKPFFQARFKDDRVFVELMRMGSNAKWTRMAGLSRVGMQALEHVDVWSNCASMTALYNLTWQDLEKENRAADIPMTAEQMEEICDRTVKNAMELVGQPQRLTQRSMMAALGKNNLWVRMNCYMGGEMLNKVGMTAAIGEKSRAEGDGVIKRFGKKMLWLSTMSGVEQVILMLLDLMRGNGPDDDELPEWLVYNAITGLSGLGLLNTLPILGPTLEEVSGQLNKLITGNGKGFIKTGLLDDMLFNLGGWMRCARKFVNADEMSGEEMALAIADTIRLGAAGTGLGRGVNSTMQWCSTLSGILQSCSAAGNMVRPVLQRAINEEKKEKKERKERTRRW